MPLHPVAGTRRERGRGASHILSPPLPRPARTPTPSQAPARGDTKRTAPPARTKRPGRRHLPPGGAPAPQAGARRAGAHRSSPRPQPGHEGRLRAATGGRAAAGRTAGGGQTLSRGAGDARGWRWRRGAWRRAGASGGTAAPRKEDNSLPEPQAAGSRGSPGTIWNRLPRGTPGRARVTPSLPGAMVTAAPFSSPHSSPARGR